MKNLVDRKAPENLLRMFGLDPVFDSVLEIMNFREDDQVNAEHRVRGQIRKRHQKHHDGVNGRVEEMAGLAPDFQPVKLLELQDKIRDQMSQY